MNEATAPATASNWAALADELLAQQEERHVRELASAERIKAALRAAFSWLDKGRYLHGGHWLAVARAELEGKPEPHHPGILPKIGVGDGHDGLSTISAEAASVASGLAELADTLGREDSNDERALSALRRALDCYDRQDLQGAGHWMEVARSTVDRTPPPSPRNRMATIGAAAAALAAKVADEREALIRTGADEAKRRAELEQLVAAFDAGDYQQVGHWLEQIREGLAG